MSLEKLDLLYHYYHITYVYQTWQGGDLVRGALTN